MGFPHPSPPLAKGRELDFRAFPYPAGSRFAAKEGIKGGKPDLYL
ncbi:hypothetical protein [Tumidithrix elongata]